LILLATASSVVSMNSASIAKSAPERPNQSYARASPAEKVAKQRGALKTMIKDRIVTFCYMF
jgi:hypothetical protein